MKHRYNLTRASANRKTGPVTIITASQSTCPYLCPFHNNGCYAEQYPLKWHWDSLSQCKKGGDFRELLTRLQMLPQGDLIRYGDAGDFPGDGYRLDKKTVLRLAYFCRDHNLRLYGYTQYLCSGIQHRRHNLDVIRRANRIGITINISTAGIKAVDANAQVNLPLVTVLPSATNQAVVHSAKGRRIMVCPAVQKHVTCFTCGGRGGPLCARADRKVVIGFPAHGKNRRKIDEVVG